MTGRAYRTRPDVEERFVRRELAERDFRLCERRFDLRCRAVLLVLAIAFAVTALVCALDGAWSVGAPATVAATASATLARASARH